MRYSFLLIIIATLFTTACTSSDDMDTFTEGLCNCAEPIIEWKAGFNKDPMTFGKGREVQAKVDTCLNAYADLYKKHENDSLFFEEVRTKILTDCPKAVGSVSAMLDLLSEK